MPGFYSATDVCVLPTYREGLPNVALEAGAMRIPIVSTRVPGCVDAIKDGVTGLLIEPRDAAALVQAIRPLFNDGELRRRMGKSAREFVAEHFAEDQVSRHLLAEYQRLLAEKGLYSPPGTLMSVITKRGLDLIVAVLGLTLGLPLFVLAASALALDVGWPVFFRQQRIGLHSKPFQFLKFRTMIDVHDQAGKLLPDEQRLTALGRFLRSSSLDELPQIWNVLKGDMSLVGPRPLLPEYLPRYTAFQRRRHEVRPGVTGWVQVNGRNSLTWEQKFELDVWYVDHRSLWLDARILWMTVLQVLRREGISQAGHATMPEFVGSEALEPRTK